MPQRSSSVIALLTTALLPAMACAEYTMDLAGWPEWVSESMAKETRKLKPRAITTPDESIRTNIAGKANKPELIEDGWYFASDIKAESPLECYIYTTNLDMASLTNVLAENNIAAMQEAYGTVDNRNVYHLDSGEISGLPFLALEWLYTVTGEDQTLVAFTKTRVAVKDEMAFACTHNAIGYRESFATAFEQFVTGAEYEIATASPYYEEIVTMDINGFGTGVLYAGYTIDEDGDTEAYSAEAILIPTSASSLMYTDSISISYSTPDLQLISAIQVDVENGEISNNLRLEYDENGNWLSSGTLQGKAVSTEIDGALNPISNRGMISLTRDLFDSEDESATMSIWIPAADPTRFIDATISRDDSEVERQANLTLGPMEINGTFDEFGNMKTGKLAAGPVVIQMNRIWTNGSIWE